MEEEFVGKWEKLEPLDWERFKSQKLEKWLSPQRLEKIGLKDADKHYADFAKETKQEDLKEQVNEQKGGFRAQKWFGELVMDFRVLCSLQIKGYNKTSVEFTNYKAAQKYGTDVKINALLSTVEVKMMNYGKKQGYISLNGWDSNPCSYVAFIEALDEEYLTFKFAGWLHGN